MKLLSYVFQSHCTMMISILQSYLMSLIQSGAYEQIYFNAIGREIVLLHFGVCHVNND